MPVEVEMEVFFLICAQGPIRWKMPQHHTLLEARLKFLGDAKGRDFILDLHGCKVTAKISHS